MKSKTEAAQPDGQRWGLSARNGVPSFSSGLVIGILEVALAISFAALIFSGPLAAYVPFGIGYALAGAIIGGALIALFTSLPGLIGGNQDVPAAIMALMSVAIVEMMPVSATTEEAFITVTVAIALTTLLTGLFFLATGYFRLGDMARFLPYPVVGGFLAGTGWLLITGAVSLLAELPVELSQLPALFTADVLWRWLPALLLALLIMLLMNRFDHYLLLPLLLLISLLAFFIVGWAAGFSPADLSAGGWLLGPFAGEGLWRPLAPADLAVVYWPAILRQAAGIVTIMLVGTVSLLLNASGVELAVNEDVDLDRELRAAGIANLFSGPAAGIVGFQQLSLSVLNFKLKANTRLTGLVGVAVCLLALLEGAQLLAFFPKMIVGALLFLLGLSFIVEWVVDGWAKMPPIDYAILIVILLVTALVGFFEAVGLGLLLAVILFVVGYSRVEVVRHALSGATVHSREVRSRDEANLLAAYGEESYILQLQGFVFFGTADSLLKQVRQRLHDEQKAPLRAVFFDLDYVNGLDTTAMISFSKMRAMAESSDFALVFCGANQRMRKQLQQGVPGGEEAAVFYFDSLDRGLAWYENHLLDRLTGGGTCEGGEGADPAALFSRQIVEILRAEHLVVEREQWAAIQSLSDAFERIEVAAGTEIIRRGEPADTLYFLAAGKTTAQLTLPEGRVVRLETVGSGWIVGEIGFFLGGQRTADVLAEEESVLFRLTRKALAHLEETDPAAASLLRRFVATLLAERVTRLTNMVRALDR